MTLNSGLIHHFTNKCTTNENAKQWKDFACKDKLASLVTYLPSIKLSITTTKSSLSKMLFEKIGQNETKGEKLFTILSSNNQINAAKITNYLLIYHFDVIWHKMFKQTICNYIILQVFTFNTRVLYRKENSIKWNQTYLEDFVRKPNRRPHRDPVHGGDMSFGLE